MPPSNRPPSCTRALVPPLQLNGSLARAAIQELLTKGLIKPVTVHASQQIYTRAVAGA